MNNTIKQHIKTFLDLIKKFGFTDTYIANGNNIVCKSLDSLDDNDVVICENSNFTIIVYTNNQTWCMNFKNNQTSMALDLDNFTSSKCIKISDIAGSKQQLKKAEYILGKIHKINNELKILESEFSS